MVRVILKGSHQISPDDWGVYHKTVLIDNTELEKAVTEMDIVGGEIVKNTPLSSNSDYMSASAQSCKDLPVSISGDVNKA